MNITVFHDVRPCDLVEIYQIFTLLIIKATNSLKRN